MKQKALLFNLRTGFYFAVILPAAILAVVVIILIYLVSSLAYLSNQEKAIEAASEASGVVGTIMVNGQDYVSALIWGLGLVFLIFGS